MTAEALKPFLNSANGPTTVADCASKTTKHKCMFFGLVTFCFLIMFSLIGITIWNFVRMSELKNDINSLNKLIEGMQKKLGLDYYDELTEFENSYKNVLDGGPLDDDRYDDEDDDDDDFEMDGSGSGSYEYDDSESDDKLIDDLGKYNESINKKRKSRAITEINGIPVYHESYAVRRNKTGGPEDDQIVKHLLHRSPVPTLRYDWGDKLPQEQLLRPETRYVEAKAANPTVIRVDPQSRHIVYHQPQTRKNPIHPNRPWAQNSNDLRPQSKTHHRINHKFRKPNGVLAVHYNLNRVNIRDNYLAKKDEIPNKSLYNNDDNIYITTPQFWSKNNRMDHAFPAENGLITIREAGIYYIYAQIYYHNNQDRNGFIIYHNRKPFLQCSSTIPSLNTEKGNTCHTSGITYLSQNDTIQLKDFYNNHSAIFGNAKSFIGLVRMGYPEYYQYKK